MPTDHPGAEFSLERSVNYGSYLEAIGATWGHLRFWDHLRYDAAGDLWIRGLRVMDAIRRYGSPLEIVDTQIIESRCRQFQAMATSAAAGVGYPGRLDFLYAGKANLASEVVAAARRAGWGLETSAAQELGHLEWLNRWDVLDKGCRVVCNGFKLPIASFGLPEVDPPPPAGAVELPPTGELPDARDMSYKERILAMARAGWNIVPILDSGELEAFADADLPQLDVGLRLKFGPVTSRDELSGVVSRFGMDEAELRATAALVEAAPNLRLTTLHAMVGAAETIPVDVFIASLAVAGEIWAEVHRLFPSLTELNIGGGIPPLGENYDHAGLLTGLFVALNETAQAQGVPPPDITFELGSLVAAECGFHVFKVIQQKSNHVDAGLATDWAIVDGGLMAAIPDMLFLGKSFRFLTARGANAPARPVRIGDLTCDGDGRYPPESFGHTAGVLLPDSPGPHYFVIQGVGAYQEILAGVRGAHHCGLLEAPELIVERRGGRVQGRLMPRQTHVEAKQALGYTEDAAQALRECLEP